MDFKDNKKISRDLNSQGQKEIQEKRFKVFK